MPHYKLIYFNVMARAEPARLIFAQAGVDYEDVRIAREEWAKMKPTTPMGQLPILEEDGKVLAQSHAINRYLATKFGLAGKDYFESALCDMYVDGWSDALGNFRSWFMENDPEKKKIVFDALIKNDIKPAIARYEKFLADNGTGYLVGNSVTWADLLLFQSFSFWSKKAPDLLNEFPNVQKLVETVGNLPNIKTWLEKRPKTEI